MKRFWSALLAAAMLVASVASPMPLGETGIRAGAGDGAGPWSSYTPAEDILSEITVGWNLGDDLDCYYDAVVDNAYVYEQYWGNLPATKEMVQNIHAAGFNTIRIPVTWEQKLDENDRVKDFWMDRVQEVVNYAYDDGMYVILDLHHDTNFGWLAASESSWNDYQGRFASLWAQIAERFADYDEHLLFEGFNEILNEEGDWGFWDDAALSRRDAAITYTNKWNQLFVDTVRAGSGYNPERVLICNTYAASCVENVLSGDVRFELPEDTSEGRIITDVHFYQPYEFVDDPTGKTTYEASDYITMLEAFDVIERYLSGPILIDEFGTRDKGNTADREAYTKGFMRLAEGRNYKCCVWDSGVFVNEFGLFYRPEGAWHFPGIAEAILKGAGVENVSVLPKKDYSGDSNLAADPYRYLVWADHGASNYIQSVDESSLVFKVLSSGSQRGDNILQYRPVAFEQGKTYRISFDISCDGISEISDGTFGVGYLLPDFSADVLDLTEPLTVTDSVMHKTFLYTSTAEENNCLYFYLHSVQGDAYTVTVSNLSVIAADEVEPTEEPTAEPTAPTEEPESTEAPEPTGQSEDPVIAGDVNADGTFNAVDVVLLQKWLLAVPGTQLASWKAADFCEDDRLNVTDLCLMKQALLTAGTTVWEVVDMGITEYRYISNTAIDVTVTETGEDTWWAQVYLPYALEAGATYEVQFTIRADAAHTFNACVQQNSGDYITYYYKEMTAKTSAQTVKERFTVDEDCPDAKLGFNLGYEAGQYHLTNVRLTRVG